MSLENDTIGVYMRRSSEEQSDEHQRDDIERWLERHDRSLENVQLYVEGAASGASDNREEFTRLIEDIENNELKYVVVWEISRLARKGTLAQRFFDSCEDHDVIIHVTNGNIREVKPDGTGRLVADIIASVAAQERRDLIRRTKSGQRRAREAGKWHGKPPLGFKTEEGFLKPILDPDYTEGETGYFDVVEALERMEKGTSYNKAADETPNCTRQTLSKIHQGDRRQWYTVQEADDDRVQDALETVGDAI